MRKTLYLAILGVAILVAACGGKKGEAAPEEGNATKDLMLKNDKTIYGLACEGCNDSVVWLLPSQGDPVKYDIIDAMRNHKVIGDIKIGDWIGILRNPQDSTVADFVIDLDQLKGSWCYIVMPKMRDWDKMSARQQARMQKNMPDSVKEQYLIPREYGFTLQRQFKASSIGRVPMASSLEDESPVVYPQMSEYFAWHVLNGKLVLTRYDDEAEASAKAKGGKMNQKERPTVNDTIDVDFLSDDSLVLSSEGISRSYYRISKASDANKLAREKAEKLAKAALKSVTGDNSAAEDKEENQKVKAAERKENPKHRR